MLDEPIDPEEIATLLLERVNAEKIATCLHERVDAEDVDCTSRRTGGNEGPAAQFGPVCAT